MKASFVHLRVHTEYSLSDGVVRIPELMARTAELGMPAVALTDAGNLFAAVKFYRAAEAAGIKPIIGVDLNLVVDAEGNGGTVTLLITGHSGYRALSRLITRGYTEGQHAGRPEIQVRWIGDGAPELIALVGRHSPIGRALAAGDRDRAHASLQVLQVLFPQGVYLELTRTGRAGEEPYNQSAVALAVETNTPAVATNDVRFLNRDDFEAHEARVAIHQGYRLTESSRPRFYSSEQYLKSPDEMAEQFADLPEALAASVAIAERANFELHLGGTVLPAFPVPPGEDESSQVGRDARAGLEKRLMAPGFSPSISADAYRERLEQELDVIVRMGFSGYFLIVADFIGWARAHDVPVGPGRGSGAGSVVAYALGITDLDPLAYGLLFERFLNPERVSMPDFDIDFCMEGRDKVIEYVADRYGRDRVSQIITYGSMAARAVVRDVGRVLGHPYGYVDKIAKLVPFEIGMTLERALKESQELRALYDSEEEVRTLIDLAQKLEGLARNAGKHAGGIVIAPSTLTDFMPLYCEQGSSHPVTQFDKDDVETVGLVKFDFLGLRTLTIIDWVVKAINARHDKTGGPPLDISVLPLDDLETYEQVFKKARTVAVFQFESAGMQRLLKDARPDRFEDIIALGALYRPGPMELIPSFVARKHGREQVKYPDPRVESILKETYGIMVYQEQVMQMAQIVGGYTLGGADLLRRAMGKKKPDEMVKHRIIFREGAAKSGLSGEKADQIFDLMEKFAGYGFNKSHAAAYALLSYQTAWLKTHYPAEFMAAVLSSDMDHTDKIVMLIDECRRMRIEILPPNVNRSAYAFTVESDGCIRYGLGAIKGLGRSAAEALVDERENAGLFASLAGLCERADPVRLNRRAFEALIESGALDELGSHRAALLAELPEALAAADQRQRAGAAGQVDLFGLPHSAGPRGIDASRWNEHELLAREKRTLGLYLSGHPLQRYKGLLASLGAERIGDLMGESPVGGASVRPVRIAGLVVEARRFGSRTAVTIDDSSGRIEVVFFDDKIEGVRKLLIPDSMVVVDGKLAYNDYFNRWQITPNSVIEVNAAAERDAGCVWIDWRSNGENPQEFVGLLKGVLAPHQGGTTAVAIRYRAPRASVCLRLGADWRVAARNQLIESLQALEGVEQVEVTYKRPGYLSEK